MSCPWKQVRAAQKTAISTTNTVNIVANNNTNNTNYKTRLVGQWLPTSCGRRRPNPLRPEKVDKPAQARSPHGRLHGCRRCFGASHHNRELVARQLSQAAAVRMVGVKVKGGERNGSRNDT